MLELVHSQTGIQFNGGMIVQKDKHALERLVFSKLRFIQISQLCRTEYLWDARPRALTYGGFPQRDPIYHRGPGPRLWPKELEHPASRIVPVVDVAHWCNG